jgi:hypothetical protein
MVCGAVLQTIRFSFLSIRQECQYIWILVIFNNDKWGNEWIKSVNNQAKVHSLLKLCFTIFSWLLIGQFFLTVGQNNFVNKIQFLILDVDQAPPDVLSALEPLIQKRELHILSRGMVIRAHPGFHLFITSRCPLEDVTKLRFAKLSQQLSVTLISRFVKET